MSKIQDLLKNKNERINYEDLRKQFPWIYKKKQKCELCGFKAQDKVQLDVLFVDGNLRNTVTSNLKTVCANCNRLMHVKKHGWKQGDLAVDH